MKIGRGLKFIVLRVLLLPMVSLVTSHAALKIAHAGGWYPEDQLAKLLLASPSFLQIDAVRWTLIALAAISVWAVADYFLYRRNKRVAISAPPETKKPPKHAPSFLEMTFGEHGSFVQIPKHSLYGITRQFQIGLRNTSRDTALTDCRVQITEIVPVSGFRLPRLLKQGFNLAAGDQIFIPLVSYGEAREPDKFNCADSIMVVSGDREMSLDIKESSRITIRATALESPCADITCVVWVDGLGKLRIRDSNGSTSCTQTVDRDAWLSDAIWRAYLGKWERPDRDSGSAGVGELAAQRLHDIVVGEIRQRAFEGKLPIWGKRKGSSLWEPVPAEFWKANRVNYLTILHEKPEKILLERDRTSARNDEWEELMTSKKVVEDLWP
ncbi:hypothetical protein BH09MYX1_BH09MYX1_67400 [soil metagenome]